VDSVEFKKCVVTGEETHGQNTEELKCGGGGGKRNDDECKKQLQEDEGGGEEHKEHKDGEDHEHEYQEQRQQAGGEVGKLFGKIGSIGVGSSISASAEVISTLIGQSSSSSSSSSSSLPSSNTFASAASDIVKSAGRSTATTATTTTTTTTTMGLEEMMSIMRLKPLASPPPPILQHHDDVNAQLKNEYKDGDVDHPSASRRVLGIITIIREILSCIPTSDLLPLRMVCKKWNKCTHLELCSRKRISECRLRMTAAAKKREEHRDNVELQLQAFYDARARAIKGNRDRNRYEEDCRQHANRLEGDRGSIQGGGSTG